MNHQNHRESSIGYRASRIENPVIYVPIRHTSTTVENPLQIDLFMQNKPNSPNVQIYISIYYIKDYQNFIPLAGYKNKPNSNPKQTLPWAQPKEQSNGPILSAVGGLQKMNVESLARKYGSTNFKNQKNLWTIPKRTITIISSYRLSISDLY